MRKTILITGASSGLGRGMAVEFAKMGRNLALCARRIEQLEELKVELLKLNPSIQVWVKPLDVNDAEQVFAVFKAFMQQISQHGLQLDRVIINAGLGKGASLGTGKYYANRQTAETNFLAALTQTEAAMEIFREQNAGHLVTISSMSALRGFRRALNVYSATKAALSTLTEGLRIDLMGTPIKASCVHPGFIRTELSSQASKQPFSVDLETGCKAMVRAIEKEKANSYVPGWPWLLFRCLLPIMPDAMVRKMS